MGVHTEARFRGDEPVALERRPRCANELSAVEAGLYPFTGRPSDARFAPLATVSCARRAGRVTCKHNAVSQRPPQRIHGVRGVHAAEYGRRFDVDARAPPDPRVEEIDFPKATMPLKAIPLVRPGGSWRVLMLGCTSCDAEDRRSSRKTDVRRLPPRQNTAATPRSCASPAGGSLPKTEGGARREVRVSGRCRGAKTCSARMRPSRGLPLHRPERSGCRERARRPRAQLIRRHRSVGWLRRSSRRRLPSSSRNWQNASPPGPPSDTPYPARRGALGVAARSGTKRSR